LSESPGTKEWSPWTEVDDREELRHRLEELSRSPRLLPEHHDFVRFFFRASDPVLYPLAAMTLGRHASDHPELADWLERYAAARGIALADPVPLVGIRSHRRLLIALAARRAAHPAIQEGALWPLPSELPRNRPADLAIYLRALAILVAGRDAPEARIFAVSVVEDLATEPETLVEGAGAERWAHLLQVVQTHSDDVDEDWAGRLWDQVADAFQRRTRAPESMGLGRRLAYHRALAGLRHGMQAGDRVAPSPSDVDGEAVRHRLGARLRLLGAAGEWWSTSEADRAAAAFDLLDGTLAWPLPSTELHRLLDAFELPGSDRAAARVLLAIARREGVSAAELLDAPSLHAMDDPELLLELLPTERPGELGAALADALEHRMRMAMATDPDSDPSIYLARVEVKRPHPAFLQLLRGVAADREYVDTRGEPVPLNQWLQDLQEELRATREGDVPALLDVPEIPGALTALRGRIRRALAEMDGQADPFSGLARLAVLLEPQLEEGEPGDPGESSSSPAGLPPLLERLEGATEGLQADARFLRRGAERLVPARLREVEGVREAVWELHGRLLEIEDGIARRLPHPEAFLLARALDELRAGMDEWVRALEGLERVQGGSTSDWDSVFQEAAGGGQPAFRARLLPVAWRTLVGASPAGGSDGVDLIEWAIRSGQELPPGARESWLEAVASHWSAMVDQGMEGGLETRVARLVRQPGARALAMLPGVEEPLGRVRTWFFDCYRLADAALATRALNLRRGEGSLVTLPRDFLAFFLHYSPVWLALLVGAILMLDFGDAWTAMAEVGDTQGILVTFVVGLVGAFGYVAAELHSRVRDGPGERVWLNRARRFLRAGVFVLGALVYTLAVVSLLWWLLSGTDEVVHGAGAVLHVVVWSGFALFVGVFFGLMAKGT